MVLTATGVALALNAASTASAADVSVLVVAPFPLERYAAEGAIGLAVPASGAWVSRASALASLKRGKLRASKLGGVPPGPDLIQLGTARAAITIYVALPTPGRHPNDRRYPIAIVGGGYHGLLDSETRIPGLVSLAEVAPTVLDLRRGESPPIGWRAEPRPVQRLRDLEERIEDTHSSRLWARIVMISAALTFAAASLPRRSPTLATAAILAAPLALAATLVLSGLGESGALVTAVVLVLLLVVAAPFLARALGTGRRLGVALVSLLVLELVVLVARPEWASLSAIGPHPDGGGRFYGIGNNVETLLLVPTILGAALLGRRWLPAVAILALVTVGWSRAGADGGGLLVVAAGLLVLWLRLRGKPLTARRAAIVVLVAVAAGLALAGVDAVTGGSSHVTDAVGGGPVGLWHDWTRRLRLSYATVTSTPLTLVLWLASVAGILAVARARRRAPVIEALVAALAVSLVFNDSPSDVARLGAVSAAVLWAWTRVPGATARTG